MAVSRQLEEVLSWRLITEIWRRFPNRYCLIESHPSGGQYNCLSLIRLEGSPISEIDVNRGGGSVQVLLDEARQAWPNWPEHMLNSPRQFVDSIVNAKELITPSPLPKSTATTISLRFICEFLTHTVGRLESWECRNGFFDTSAGGGGRRNELFRSFPSIVEQPKNSTFANGNLHPAYGFWFLTKNARPMLCIDINGQLATLNGESHDLVASYAAHKRIWPVIAETALELLP